MSPVLYPHPEDPKSLEITAVDIPFGSVAPSDPPRKRAEYITLERILPFGVTLWLQFMCIRLDRAQPGI